MSRLAHDNIFLDPRGTTVVYTDQGATFDSDQPLLNLSKMQLPLFAQFTGATAELDADAGASYTVDTLALLGHTLENGMEVEFLDGMTSLGTATVTNYRGLAQNVILVLDTPVSLQTLTISITGGTGGVDYRIGALWASGSLDCCISPDGFGAGVESLSQVSWADATPYSDERASQGVPTFKFTPMPRAAAIGPAYPNVNAIFREIGTHAPVIVIPYIDTPALATYGLTESTTGPTETINKLWRAGMTIRQQG